MITFTKAIMKKLMDQCRKLKYLHQVKLYNSLHLKHGIGEHTHNISQDKHTHNISQGKHD